MANDDVFASLARSRSTSPAAITILLSEDDANKANKATTVHESDWPVWSSPLPRPASSMPPKSLLVAALKRPANLDRKITTSSLPMEASTARSGLATASEQKEKKTKQRPRDHELESSSSPITLKSRVVLMNTKKKDRTDTAADPVKRKHANTADEEDDTIIEASKKRHPKRQAPVEVIELGEDDDVAADDQQPSSMPRVCRP